MGGRVRVIFWAKESRRGLGRRFDPRYVFRGWRWWRQIRGWPEERGCGGIFPGLRRVDRVGWDQRGGH